MNKTILSFGLLIFIFTMFSQSAFAKAPLNSHCVMDSDCESNLCNVVSEKCVKKGPINSPCGLDSECESNMCNIITLTCTNAELEARGSEVQWLINLVRKNTGKFFCIPKGTKVRQGVAALNKFSKAHPEIHEPLTDKQAIQALAESFPCTVAFADQSPTNDEERKIVRLIKENSGIALCVPTGTKLGDGVNALANFSKAHPEIHGPLTDEQALQALAESFPCAVTFADQYTPNYQERQVIRLIKQRSVANTSVDWSPDGKWIATAGGDPMRATIWDSVSLAIRHRLNDGLSDWGGDSINFSPDSKYLASGLGAVNVWNVADGTLKATLIAPHSISHKRQYHGIKSVRFSPDGKKLVVVYTGDKQIVIAYRIADGNVAWTYEPKLTLEPQRFIKSPLLTTPLVFTPDGKRVLFCTGEWSGHDAKLKLLSRILMLDAESGVFMGSIDDIHITNATALAISRDGKWVATGTSTGERYEYTDEKTHQVVIFDNEDPVRIWNLETGKLYRELPVYFTGQQSGCYPPRVWSLVFSKDGKYLFGATRYINVWDIESGKMVQEAKSSPDPMSEVPVPDTNRCYCRGSMDPEPMSLALSPEGHWLAASFQNKLSIYELMNFRTPAPPPSPVKEKVTIRLNVQFDTNKAVVKEKYHDEIKRVADFMKEFPDTTAVIEGHTDNIASAAYNQKLSEKRANSVRQYLIDKFGIDSSRITATGYGLTKPTASNDTEEGRQKNRRIDAVMEAIRIVQ